MRFYLFLFVLLSTAITTYSQNTTQTIKGIVIDKNSLSPLPSATIKLLHTDPRIGAISNKSGNFKIDNVPVGRYDIQVSFVGYEPLIIREVVVSSAKETFVNAALKEIGVSVGEVIVKPTVNKVEPINAMSTVSARMLSVEEAKRYAGGFDDPARLASAFAGVASNVGSNGIVVRGNAPKFLQWKMEEIEIPNPNHFADMASFGGGGLTALSSQLLANSDFLTGAFPAEYTNALSGVFDIFMRNGNNESYEHTFQFGLVGIDIASEGPFQKGSSSYLFNYRYSTLSLLTPLLPEDADGTSYQDFSFKLNFPTQTAGTFAFWGIGLLDRSGQKAETDSTKWKYIQDKEEQDVKQSMGVIGLNHTYIASNNMYIKSNLAATLSGLRLDTKRINSQLELLPQNIISTTNQNFVLSSYLNTKFNIDHTNKTGFTITGLQYNMMLKQAENTGEPLQTYTDEAGFSTLIAAYSNSTLNLTNALTMNAGISSQLFTLNNKYTIEPRLAFRLQLPEDNGILGVGYGNHSRLERINYYFTKSTSTGDELINKNLDFTKAHHIVLSYSRNLSENTALKIEPYFQYLYSIPVIPDSSFSFINLQNEWFINKKLENTGKGRNYGVDLTLEKYISDGYYYMVTASLFNSEYLAGDRVWRSTRYNRNYLLNILFGKEWQFAQNTLGVNLRGTIQGGDRYSPVNENESKTSKEIRYDEYNSFKNQLPTSKQAHFTISYRINNQGVSHEIALKIINATMQKDFNGYRYNTITNSIDENS
ncbi:MAG: carboxypeptidase-like regulatory domain-containing protein, partial [Bacteroidetes bacterium]|nr:carboxypeptidase-like regulatory domain-containing protein [Bacteroidota bacterium]